MKAIADAALFDQLLLALDVHVEAFAACEVGPGWRLALDPMEHPVLHSVLAGAGILTVESGPALRFARDYVLLIPPRRATKLEPPEEGGDREVAGHSVARRTEDGLLRLQPGTGESTVMVTCGTIRATYGGTLGPFDRLDRVIVENFTDVPAIRTAVEAMQLAKQEPDLRWLAATSHPKLGKSVLAMRLSTPATTS